MAKEKTILIYQHFKENMPAYVLVILVFVAGLVFGSLAVKNLPIEEGGEINSFLQQAFGGIKENNLAAGIVFKNALINNSKWIVLVWLSGLTLVTIPVTLGIEGFKGFSLGFALSYFMKQFQMKGFGFILAAVLPQNLIYIPALAFLGILSIGHAFRRHLAKNNPERKKELLRYYAIWLILILLAGVLSATVEMAISGFGLQKYLYGMIPFAQ